MLQKYVVKSGYAHGFAKKYKAGDVVEMEEHEAFPLLFKLELFESDIDPEKMRVEVPPEEIVTKAGAWLSEAQEDFLKAINISNLDFLSSVAVGKLSAAGIETCFDLVNIDPAVLSKKESVTYKRKTLTTWQNKVLDILE